MRSNWHDACRAVFQIENRSWSTKPTSRANTSASNAATVVTFRSAGTAQTRMHQQVLRAVWSGANADVPASIAPVSEESVCKLLILRCRAVLRLVLRSFRPQRDFLARRRFPLRGATAPVCDPELWQLRCRLLCVLRLRAAGLWALLRADMVALRAAPLAGLPHPSPKVLGCSAPLSDLKFFPHKTQLRCNSAKKLFLIKKYDKKRVRRPQ